MSKPILRCDWCRMRRAAVPGGLCRRCTRTPEVAAQYPPEKHRLPEETDTGETLEELEAKIAERLRPENLPAWWARERAKVASADGPRLSQVELRRLIARMVR